jgi:hypothetical protein
MVEFEDPDGNRLCLWEPAPTAPEPGSDRKEASSIA